MTGLHWENRRQHRETDNSVEDGVRVALKKQENL